jgi:hypothetical protein
MLPPAVDRAAVSRSFVGKLETGATAGADEEKTQIRSQFELAPGIFPGITGFSLVKV